MKFWASAETDALAFDNIYNVTKYIEPKINRSLQLSSLSEIYLKIRYIPIVMSDDSINMFPSRSKVRKKSRIYDCAPQLGFRIFTSGTWNEQIENYLNGLRECASRLNEFGASKEQAQEFIRILEELNTTSKS